MSKRQVSKQQQSRIDKLQSRYLNKPSDWHEEGLVVSRFGHHAEVELADRQVLHCAIRPHIDSLVAGDKVVIEASSNQQYVVVTRFPRQSELARVDKKGLAKPVAANITQGLVVTAVKPELSFPLLDSYLVMLETLKLKAP